MTTENENSSESPDARIGKVIDRKYKILSRVGVGGMGVVYEAEHELMGRRVAVKVLHRHLVSEEQFDTFMQRFQREARTASQINHPNAVMIYDFGISRGMAYLVMEFVEGRSLKSVLAAEGRLDIQRAVEVFSQVCEAVSAAHKLGIVHRDLKPDNIMLSVDADGKEIAQVLDFGIAKVLSAAPQDTSMTMTQAGTTLGTPRYMSPEQVLGKTIDARSDVYALGVVLYEMLTGDIPFKADSAMELMLKHVSEAPLPMRSFDEGSNVPRDVEAVVMKTLEKAAENRYQTVGELSYAFRAAVKRSTGTNVVIPAAARKPKFKSTKAAATVAATTISQQLAMGKKYGKQVAVGAGTIAALAAVFLWIPAAVDKPQPAVLTKSSPRVTDSASLHSDTVLTPPADLKNLDKADSSKSLPQPDANKILAANITSKAPEAAAPESAEVAQPESAREAMQSLLELEQSESNVDTRTVPAIEEKPASAPASPVLAAEQQQPLVADEQIVKVEISNPISAPAVTAPENTRARLSDTALLDTDKTSSAGEAPAKLETVQSEPATETLKTIPAPAPTKTTEVKDLTSKSPAVDSAKPAAAAAKTVPLVNQSVAQLIDALKDEKREVREQAGRLLQTRGQEPVAPLMQAMNSPHVRVRYWATFILGQLRAKEAVPLLIRALDDKVPMISQTAQVALRKIGTPEALRAINIDPDSVADKSKNEDGWLW